MNGMNAPSLAQKAEMARLSNGVVLIADPMPGLASTALSVTVRAGALDETIAEQGLAHLLEHMAFKGTKTRTARALAEAIESVGGSLNAATGYETTSYEARILGDHLPLAFELLAEILQAPTLAADDLAKERDVVLQEIAEAVDTPDDVVFELLQTAAFGAHPLGRPILGTKETVRAHTTADLHGFINAHYGPAAMVISVSGAVDPGQVQKLSEMHFGAAGVSAGDAPPSRAHADGASRAGDRTPATYCGGVKNDKRKAEQTHIAFAAEGVGVDDPSLPALQVFTEAFGGGWSSRLFQSVREERGLSYSVYSFADVYQETGLIGAYAGVEGDNAPDAARLIRQTLEEMATNTDQAEIDRARAMIKAGVVMEMETPDDRADAWTADYLSYGKLISAAEECARLDEVTLHDVRAAAAALLEAPLSLSVVGPGDADAVAVALGA